MTLYFPYSLTATQTPTFGYIKWTPDVAVTNSFCDIVFGRYARQGMGKKTTTKNMEWVRCHYFLVNISHGVISVSWKMRDK